MPQKANRIRGAVRSRKVGTDEGVNNNASDIMTLQPSSAGGARHSRDNNRSHRNGAVHRNSGQLYSAQLQADIEQRAEDIAGLLSTTTNYTFDCTDKSQRRKTLARPRKLGATYGRYTGRIYKFPRALLYSDPSGIFTTKHTAATNSASLYTDAKTRRHYKTIIKKQGPHGDRRRAQQLILQSICRRPTKRVTSPDRRAMRFRMW